MLSQVISNLPDMNIIRMMVREQVFYSSLAISHAVLFPQADCNTGMIVSV